LIRYFATSGDKHGWAIDEDLRLIRRALQGKAREAALWSADVVHSPFWMALDMHHPGVLRRKFVIAHADNPPFFYLTQPEFLAAQQQVDLWVARSKEAAKQFADLGLAAEHVPYAIDESVFFPLPDRASLRDKYGIPREAYVIGNFHRDSEGSDLAKPKLQKSPETLVAILRMVKAEGLVPHVLLAGPRRHWIREALQKEGISFTFVGRGDIAGDDFGINILSRPQLNELYNACDLYLIASRWEGGPQSAMEAAAARTKMLSLPLGVAADILEQQSLFDTPAEAAEKIFGDMRHNSLACTLDPQKQRLLANHTADAMSRGLQVIYENLPAKLAKRAGNDRSPITDMLREVSWQCSRRSRRGAAKSVRIRHVAGTDAFMDEAMANLERILPEAGISVKGGAQDPAVAGSSNEDADFRVLPIGGEDTRHHDLCGRIAFSVQDAVNFRSGGGKAPVVVCPLVFSDGEKNTSPLVVGEKDRAASLRISQCLRVGGTTVYPRESAYYYQVFHAGVPYGGERSQSEAVEIATSQAGVIGALGRPATMEGAVSFWKKLLSR